ncbi:MAG: bifunctional glycosyltransferase family 2/GtrA family protein [Lachnospiraceae bacterium]|nr:bifunctional glycosyltransferase family 2/GtrA family protein [Lachnospiraceae bacterium]
MRGITVVLPSLNPDEKLKQVVTGLLAEGFEDIVIVNDGSDEAHMSPFVEAGRHAEVTVLTHEVNQGKGRALKTAFAYVQEQRPDGIGVVTVDGDNQHLPKDIKACAEKMAEAGEIVFGCRNFRQSNVPWKSRFGNISTSMVLRLLCGIRLSDTQTGLRAIPTRYLGLMCEIRGERYEYETEMILELKRERIPFREMEIETVYIGENQSSHFRPIIDSFKIYRIILAFVFSSAASCLIDYLIFTVLVFGLESVMVRGMKLFLATFLARAVSSLFNYTMNRKAVFCSKAPVKQSMTRYYILCVAQAACSYGFVYLLSSLFDARSAEEVGIKLVVDMMLFFVSFRIQQAWVFAGDNLVERDKA